MRWSSAARAMAGAVLALALAAGCRSLPESEGAVGPSAEGAVAFGPARHVAPAMFASGAHDDLYAPETFAVWADARLAEEKREADLAAGQPIDPTLDADAAAILRDFIVIELHLVSGFGDTASAVENVDLRGMQAFLEWPDGRRMAPIQRVFATSLGEEEVDGGPRYRRTIFLVFPVRDLWLGQPLVDPDADSATLALEGRESRYTFTWPRAGAAESEAAVTDADDDRRTRVGYTELFRAVRRAARLFGR